MVHCCSTCVTAHALLPSDEVRKERAKETKHDTTIELAALLHEVIGCACADAQRLT